MKRRRPPSGPPGPWLELTLLSRRELALLPLGAGLLALAAVGFVFRGAAPPWAIGLVWLGVAVAVVAGGIATVVGAERFLRAGRATTVVFDRDLRLVNLFGRTRSIPWAEVPRIEAVREERRFEATETDGFFFAWLPLLGFISFAETRTILRTRVSRRVVFRGWSGRTLLTLPGGMPELRFSLWHARNRLRDWVESRGGAVLWDHRGLTAVSLVDFHLSEPERTELRRLRCDVSELTRIDLAGPPLDAPPDDEADDDEADEEEVLDDAS